MYAKSISKIDMFTRERESKKLRRFVKTLFSFFLFVTFFFMVHSSVHAATYYVATTGNDSNTTTQAQISTTPWLTLNHAESAATNGDTVHVAAGTYVENDATTHGWNSQKGIAWIADGAVIVRGTSPTIRPLYIATSSTANYNGFTIDAQGLYSYSLFIQSGASNKTFTNMIFQGATSSLVGSAGSPDTIVFSNSTFIATAGYAVLGNYSHITISGSIFNLSGSSSAYSSITGGAGNITLSNNTITATSASTYPIIYLGEGPLTLNITNNSIDAQSLSQANDLIVVNNPSTITSAGTIIIDNNILKSRYSGGHIILIGSENTSAGNNVYDGVLIQNNTLYGPLYYNGGLSNVTSHSIFVGFNKNAVIRYNTVYGGGYGVVVKGGGMAYTSGGIYYNKFINSTGTVAVRVKGIQNIPITNNTIYTASTYPNGTLIYISDNGAGESSTGTVLKNNILYGESSNPAVFVDTDSQTNFTSDYNLIFTTASSIGTVGSTTYNTFGSWQTAGYDIHGVNASPLFNDSSNNIFTLQSNSPAINAGVDLGFTRDFAGTGVPQGSAPDIGAYEYTPSVPGGAQPSYPAYSGTAPLPVTITEMNNVISIVNAGVFKYDAYLSVGVTPKTGTFRLKNTNYWQAGSIYEVWWKSFFNDAKILPSEVVKPFTLIFKYDTSALEKSLPEKRLGLAYSTDSKTWKIIPSILDTKKKQLVIVTKNGGYYMLVSGYPQTIQSVQGAETEIELTMPEPSSTPAIQPTPPTQAPKPKHCIWFMCW